MRARIVDLRGASGGLAKLLVEPAERRFAAALLLDASCILFPLPPIDKNRQINLQSPPCSDACFLRLHNKQQHQQQIQLQFGQFSLQQQQLGRTFFLVASPASGGSLTEIRAWSCGDNARIRQIPVELGPASVQSMVARLEVPHSPSGVKMVASVNVVVVYSPSVAKLWILAAKPGSSQQHRMPSLLLVKTVVVDCGARLYSMHVSPQYLLLGEAGSVRVLPLRPLLKRRRTKHREADGNVEKEVASIVKRKKKNGYINDELEDGRVAAMDGNLDTNQLKSWLSVRAVLSSSHHVVAIRPVSVKSFLALDSSGRLHLLTLRRPVGGSLPVEVKPLEISFAVSAFAVLPYDPKATAGPRRLWASDGRYSIHVLSLPDEEVDGGRAVEPSVVQAVFLGASAVSLVASSPETVLAVTEGAVVAYVYGGS